MRKQLFAILAVALASAAPALSADTAAALDKARYMGVDEIHPGMKGFGRTVMSGTEIIPFQVEVVSILHNAFQAKQDVILIRCAGAGLEHSGVIAGMSGSPIYLTDENGGNPRMIGALAYGWSMSKDPLAGVQPINQMLRIQGMSDKPKTATKPTPTGVWNSSRSYEKLLRESRYAVLAPRTGRTEDPLPADDARGEAAGLRPLVAPVMVSGMSETTLGFVREQMKGTAFEPVATGGFGSAERDANVKLEPGSVLCVPLMRGDSQMDAVGTCTEVVGDRVLAFGHAFFAEGPVDCRCDRRLHSVVPTIVRSFKLGSSLRWSARSSGTNRRGLRPRRRRPGMIPVHVTCARDSTEEFKYECVQQVRTAVPVMTAVFNSLSDHSNCQGTHESIHARHRLQGSRHVSFVEHTISAATAYCCSTRPCRRACSWTTSSGGRRSKA